MATTISRQPRATSVRGVSATPRQRMEDAAQGGSFADWQQAYREQEDWRKNVEPGQSAGLINGSRVADVIGSPSQIEANMTQSPFRGSVMPAPGATSNPAQVMAAAERIGLARAEEQAQAPDESLARYRQFLADVGEDPDSIGNAEILPGGRMNVPTMAQEDQARKAGEKSRAERARARIAANRLERKGDYEGAMLVREAVDEVYPRVGGRSSERDTRYWLDRMRGRVSREQRVASNGFSSPSGFNINTRPADITL